MVANNNSSRKQGVDKDDETPSPPHQVYLNGDQVYTCSGCHTHLAKNDDIISKGFQGRHGRAYLLKAVHNISLGPKEDRVLMTGLHSVADINCIICQSVVGWIYIYAFEDSQKYKEGKYIVEKAKISKENFWVQRM
ncbi:yippee zinc-binding/DNA-binding /Mis18, centromere assembly-domain-containing protein [Linnemannia elongata]|uniref:Protein yippee-like n=1 Tax=Linnemannia elongata AG-77 TaxID=1314771 RepID=A0A197K254_9FUNG|nr:hypothetical protein BGZ91_011099 [Linnemannia elongata]KAH7034157.1 yippee zinc-binding/DNA-binding /Mis18, centromere assembly-domain-containing protein [Linnemannia elongata]OAQ31283.1 yippee-like protein [Linnemannia elongata AG-77]